MHCTRLLALLALSLTMALAGSTGSAAAAQPRNPFSSFNLSGINYGSQQWERAQREGRSVWPYYNTPSRSYSRGSNVSVGGVAGGGAGGAVIQSGNYRSSPRGYRRWRR